jgi:hypothetical protein
MNAAANAFLRHLIPYVLCAVFAGGFFCLLVATYVMCEQNFWIDAGIPSELMIGAALVTPLAVFFGFLLQVFFWHVKGRLPPLLARAGSYGLFSIALSMAVGWSHWRCESQAYFIFFALPVAELLISDLILWGYTWQAGAWFLGTAERSRWSEIRRRRRWQRKHPSGA